jgi:S-DNA-T family DNA segregation ATPase FtsK/SpoIIIE
MSRFDAPLDNLEMDDLDFPTFEVPARRNSRPTTGSKPQSATRRPPRTANKTRPTTNSRRTDSFDEAFNDDLETEEFVRSPRPTSKTANGRPTTDSDLLPVRRVAKRGEKPKNIAVEVRKTTKGKPAKTSRNSTNRVTSTSRLTDNLPSTKNLRAVHFEVAGVLCMAFGALLGYYALQREIDGALPDFLLRGLRTLCGAGAPLLPLALFFTGLTLFVKRQNANLRAFFVGGGTAFLVFLTFKHLQVARGNEFIDAELVLSHGGYIGGAIAFVLRRLLGEIGAIISLGAFSIVALLLWTENSLGLLMQRGRVKLADLFSDAKEGIADKKLDYDRIREEKRIERELEAQRWEEEWEEEPQEIETPKRLPSLIRRDVARRYDDNFPVESSAQRLERLRKQNAAKPKPVVPDFEDELEEVIPVDEIEAGFPEVKFEPIPAPTLDPESTIDDPKFLAPRVEILDAAPPASVVTPEPPVQLPTPVTALTPIPTPVEVPVVAPIAPPVANIIPEIDLKAVVAGENADTELTPQEILEQQAELSSRTDKEVEHENEGEAKPSAPVRPRRSFGEGPLMPEYFDDAVRALDPPIPVDNTGAEEEISLAVKGVQETLGAFKIDARVTDVKRGPVITRYEVQPGAGVRVASIANLDKDLARSLSALAVRIEAPVPGKNVVGIEIPNKKVHLVRMRDVLEQPEFLSHPSKLAFVLGKDIAGQPKWGDLTKMPHMLIAGATNSGKSVCLNTIIASILVRSRPDEVRFSLIDPKRVELTLYRGIRHLMHDVVVEPKQAVVALRRSIEEMDRRYKLFARHQVRNIASYNSKLPPGEKPLPYIVIVIDELADLMMTAAAEFEKLICRLAQLARATGIHLIVATQRPSVNVITGVIKANIPARIAFAVASQVDSRTILDAVGAERLIGMGDMLYDSNNGGKSTRIQGAFLSEEEVNRIVEVVKSEYQYAEHDDEFGDLPTYDLYTPEDEDADFEGESYEKKEEKRDSLFDEIVEFCLRHQEMSASNIQRKFGIGYPRAGRIVDQLERAGIIGPADGPKPRKVLGRPQPMSDLSDDD